MKRTPGRSASTSHRVAWTALVAIGLAAPVSIGRAKIELPIIPFRLADLSALHGAALESKSSSRGAAATEAAASSDAADPEDHGPASSPQPAAPTPVTLSVKNMEITELLEMFSRSRGVNIVSGEDVSGRVSIELHDVPFEQALSATAAMVGCEAVMLDNIYFVSRVSGNEAPKTNLRQVRTLRLDYADPAEIEAVVREMLSQTGRVTSYAPLRSIVVDDRPDVVGRVEEVVRSLDTPPRQVLIEARIMEARLSKDMHYGVDWSLLFSPGKGRGDVTVEGFTTPEELSREGLFVTWGKGDFKAAIEALDGVEELNTLAAPKLLAVDGTQAEIIIGGELGFSVVSTLDNTVIQSVEFLDTGTQLKITPTIASDGNILMHIHPELSNGVIQENLPSKTTAEVTTDVLIKDGHTLFIGGLIRERNEQTRQGIPYLSRIPVLGVLFGRTVQSREKSELVTLITPRIIQPGQELNYQTSSPTLSRPDPNGH